MEPALISIPEDVELIYEDGIPMDSPWHRSQMNLLIDLTHQHLAGREDYYTGGNMFVYFSLRQARNRDYRGPDYFTVLGVDGTREREAWILWEEEGHYPDLIVELLSESTRDEDLVTKKRLYETVFRTPEYFCYGREGRELHGWRLAHGRYERIVPDQRGWMWSETLGLYLGFWDGTFQRIQATWLRFFDAEGRMVPMRAEAENQRAEAESQRAEAESQRAEAESQRAEAAEAEIARLRADLEALRQDPGRPPG